jgi:multicomponent Na+:H+ antiporter subunit C
MTIETFLGLYNYWIVIFLMMTGFYIVIASENLVKTIIGLNIFQTSVFLLYITMGKVHGGTAPIIKNPIGGHDDQHDAKHHVTEGHAHGVEIFTGGDYDPATTTASSNEVLDKLLDSVDVESATEIATVGFEEDIPAHGANLAEHAEIIYSNPLPSVLMLTAIVVGIATTALALALIVRIREEYGTIEEDEILEIDRNSNS